MNEGQKKPRNTGTETPLAMARRDAGMTQQYLSELLGVPFRTIQHWEAGTRTPPDYVLQLVLEKIRVTGPLVDKLEWDAQNHDDPAVRAYAADLVAWIHEQRKS